MSAIIAIIGSLIIFVKKLLHFQFVDVWCWKAVYTIVLEGHVFYCAFAQTLALEIWEAAGKACQAVMLTMNRSFNLSTASFTSVCRKIKISVAEGRHSVIFLVWIESSRQKNGPDIWDEKGQSLCCLAELTNDVWGFMVMLSKTKRIEWRSQPTAWLHF